ncbi:hypothetical protein D9611_000971 [Ephemerocybe angulata]|uniref:Transposase n=1 Tax=Ephemerocybe angulata TaxID=980116 RepID=A0A8H5BME7_9AGAR|nr:hypothetical protein D9611_000971 [Tulosesus angulatus]
MPYGSPSDQHHNPHSNTLWSDTNNHNLQQTQLSSSYLANPQAPYPSQGYGGPTRPATPQTYHWAQPVHPSPPYPHHPSHQPTGSHPYYGHTTIASPSPLGNAPSTVLNSVQIPPEKITSASNKRARAPESAAAKGKKAAAKPGTKRKRTGPAASVSQELENIPPRTCGVGPVNPLALNLTIDDSDDELFVAPPPTATSEPEPFVSDNPAIEEMVKEMHKSLVEHGTKKATEGSSADAATDVWIFMTARESDIAPAGWTPESEDNSKFIFTRPKTGKWQSYTLKKSSGMTTALRAHLVTKHRDDYEEIVRAFKLKGHEKIGKSESSTSPFSVDVLNNLIIDWLVTDDQAGNVLDNSFFRRVVLYLGEGKITDSDLLHRTQASNLILKRYDEEIERTKAELKGSPGRISFSTDLWSDPRLRSFMAVTAHYIVRDPDDGGRLKMRCGLIAFRHISGQHTGVNLAKEFFSILQGLGISHKIGIITMDNASNNDTFMKGLQDLLEVEGYAFDEKGNRVRCFPHVINIACQAIIVALEGSLPEYTAPPHYMASPKWGAFVAILQSGLLARARGVINGSCSSGQRREALANLIKEGNQRILDRQGDERKTQEDLKAGWWEIPIPLLELCRDSYEALIKSWTDHKEVVPELSHIIDIGLAKLEDYLGRTRDSRIYSLSMGK